jgi:sugar (pentulose or hexulose) kinase
MATAGEGGPYGMALLAAYMVNKKDESLEEYLANRVFAGTESTTLAPEKADVEGFHTYIENYKQLLEVERKAVEVI